jgi:hypothetical protein
MSEFGIGFFRNYSSTYQPPRCPFLGLGSFRTYGFHYREGGQFPGHQTSSKNTIMWEFT